jgi:hypothetical protein
MRKRFTGRYPDSWNNKMHLEKCCSCGREVAIKFPLIQKGDHVKVADKLRGKKSKYRKVCGQCWFTHTVNGCSQEEITALALLMMRKYVRKTGRRFDLDKIKFAPYLKQLLAGEDPFDLMTEHGVYDRSTRLK